jgi:hypothetical protein
MPADLDELSAIEHRDLVGIHDRRKPVGDDDGGSAT